MEKINIAEILKDCPKGMELDCTMYEDVCFDYVGELNIIHCYVQHETHKTSITLNQHGTPNSDIKSKCVIFPKGKTTWEGFQRPFKDGDIVAFDTEKGAQLFIFKKYIHNNDHAKCVKCYMMLDCGGEIDFESYGYYVERLATEEEKEKLFDAIKANGYKWNPETKTLEKLIEPIFKVRNKVREKGDKAVAFTITDIDDSCYYCGEYVICNICEQDEWELVPDKFDITTLKPFDKVLVRDDNEQCWSCELFDSYRRDMNYQFNGIAACYKQCIPYEENKHFLGTTNDCDEYYKN